MKLNKKYYEEEKCFYFMFSQPPCVSLWCGSDNEGCKTQHLPWADGTECGSGHWCQHGMCKALFTYKLLLHYMFINTITFIIPR